MQVKKLKEKIIEINNNGLLNQPNDYDNHKNLQVC